MFIVTDIRVIELCQEDSQFMVAKIIFDDGNEFHIYMLYD